MLSEDLNRYVDLHRGLGFKFRSQAILLRGFLRAAQTNGDTLVRTETVLAWAAQAPSPPQRRLRLLTVRRFALMMHAEDPAHEVPAADALGRARLERRAPYIYAPGEIVRLVRAAMEMAPQGTIVPQTYATLFGLLAATGLRVSEALALRCEDITADGLIVRQTKFRKDRLVPLHGTTWAALDRYLDARKQVAACNPTLFVLATGSAPTYDMVNPTFRRLAHQLGLRGRPDHPDARIHDLRHTFAVRSLEQCPGDRAAVARHIAGLSTYLGHAHVTDTYWYLSATPFLMRRVAERGEACYLGDPA
jgi:integrase